jgi:hypothetical protein
VVWPYRRKLACALIAFYALATLRGLVPGLCSTLLASSEAAEHHRAAMSCCSPEGCAPRADDGVHFYGAEAEHPPCALCHLISTLSVPVAALAVAPPAGGAVSALWIATDGPRRTQWAGGNLGRAPPYVLSEC